MDNHLTALSQLPLPLVKLIEPGIGFKIGQGDREWTFVGKDGNVWTYADAEFALLATVGFRVIGQAVIISVLLKNEGNTQTSAIEVLEPLRITFKNPPSAWRHIRANGGTSEDFYPPTAYRIHEQIGTGLSWKIESHPAGRSSNSHLPFFISLTSQAEDSEGFFCGMEWSGAWQMTLRREGDERTGLCVGIKVNAISLAPGEKLQLPDVHLGFFEGGPDAGTNALRRYLYERVCPAYQGRPPLPRVSYDHWFGIGNNVNMDLMKQQATRAAELGIEVFTVDASWFPGDFPEGVGNWDQVDPAKFPDGLEPLAEYVRSLGMDFGLWFEPERAVAGTHLVQKHPEWCIPVPSASGARAQDYHLNLANRNAQDYLIDVVGSWIKKLDLRWSRWDYNIDPMPFWQKVDPTLKIQFAYFAGLYRVLDTLMKEHPKWMVEGCASGGRRIDIGTIKRAHTYWFSDQTEIPRICRYMQARANRFLPGNLLNSSVAVGSKATDADFSDTAILSRMLGKLSFDGSIANWSPSFTVRTSTWVAAFKANRHLLVQDFYQLLPQPQTVEDWDAVQFVSHMGDEAIVFAFAGSRSSEAVLKLRGLCRKEKYVVARLPDGASMTMGGEALMNVGLAIALPQAEGGLWRIYVKR